MVISSSNPTSTRSNEINGLRQMASSPFLSISEHKGRILLTVEDPTRQSKAEIDLQGGHILSFTHKNNSNSPVRSLFWLNDKPTTSWEKSVVVRGGDQTLWPWFGKRGPTGSNQHGVARQSEFELVGFESSTQEGSVLVLRLPQSKIKEDFKIHARDYGDLTKTICVSAHSISIILEGKGDLALHPYIQLDPDSSETLPTVHGVSGWKFIDVTPETVSFDTTNQKTEESKSFPAPLGALRIYQVPSTGSITIEHGTQQIAASFTGTSHILCWRPALSQKLSDTNTSEYANICCIEPVRLPEFFPNDARGKFSIEFRFL
jgi:D-hexose-6-phosphate mutarotase